MEQSIQCQSFYPISLQPKLKEYLTLEWHGQIPVHNVLLFPYGHIEVDVGHPQRLLSAVPGQHNVDVVEEVRGLVLRPQALEGVVAEHAQGESDTTRGDLRPPQHHVARLAQECLQWLTVFVS